MALTLHLEAIDLFLIFILAVALYYDLFEKRIPNRVTVTAILVGLVYRSLTGGLTGLQDALLGGAVGLGLLLIPFVLRGMGAGDVKLLTAVGVLQGVAFVLYTAAAMAIAGGVIAVYYFFFLRLRGAHFPYGIAIAIGAVFTLGFL